MFTTPLVVVTAKLRLGEAAKRTVGNSANQLPDMAYFANSIAGNGYAKLPSGLIIQWGRFFIHHGHDCPCWPFSALQSEMTVLDKMVTSFTTFLWAKNHANRLRKGVNK
ncbi:hypothetical protein [Enterobacter hormaechei]